MSALHAFLGWIWFAEYPWSPWGLMSLVIVGWAARGFVDKRRAER